MTFSKSEKSIAPVCFSIFLSPYNKYQIIKKEVLSLLFVTCYLFFDICIRAQICILIAKQKKKEEIKKKKARRLQTKPMKIMKEA